ncbi:MAG: GNAT family N-acetyltransferase [Chitinophagaceae bacterium]|nr:GNAT family N-acetyltransferase [Chitinophagaceae bacterium]
MIELIRTNSGNRDFIELVKQLDADLAERDGAEHAFYAQFNKTNMLKHTIVAYEDGKPVGSGAIKEFSPGIMEVKRMYTVPESRGKRIAGTVLAELEKWATEMNCIKCVLETGIRQPEAIALYKRSGYVQIPNYGQYLNVENSVCFEKVLG